MRWHLKPKSAGAYPTRRAVYSHALLPTVVRVSLGWLGEKAPEVAGPRRWFSWNPGGLRAGLGWACGDQLRKPVQASMASL